MSLFEQDFIVDIKSPYSAKTQLKRLEKKLSRRAAAKDILDGIGWIPEKNTYHQIFTTGASNAGGFYESYLDKYGYVDELVLATWIMSREYALMLHDHIKKGLLGSLTMIISNRMSQLPGKKATYNYIKLEYTKEQNIHFAVINSHAKTHGIRIGDNYINIDGSGNWSENPRIENYTISESKDAYDFRKNTLTQYIEEKHGH